MEMGELHQHHNSGNTGTNSSNSANSEHHHQLHQGGHQGHPSHSHKGINLHQYSSSSPNNSGGGNNSSIGQLLSMLSDISPEDPIENLLVVSSSQDSNNGQVGVGLPLGSTTIISPHNPPQDNHSSHHPSNFMEPSPYSTSSPDYHIAYSRRKTYYSEEGPEEYFHHTPPTSHHPHHHPHLHSHLQDSTKAESSASEYDAPSSSSVASSTTPANPSGPRDEKYWERRRKNNMAAKKSRDARRVRENQLRLKVLCLENANQVLRTQLKREKDEHEKTLVALNKEKEDNKMMRHKLSRYSNEIHHPHHPTSHLPNS